MVRLPDGGSVDALDPVALQAAGIPEKYVASLLKLLRAGQMAKVKGSSPKSRAVQVAERFVRAGLTVSVTPALNVQTLVHDDRVNCPACSEHVRLTEDRKCPACGVYVDKITPSLLRKRKKIARDRERKAERESRQKINAEDRLRMEAQAAIFRKHIRADLGGAYELVEIDQRRDRRQRVLRGAALAVVATVSIAGGGLLALWVSSKGDWSLASQRFLDGLPGVTAQAAATSGQGPIGAASGVTLRGLALENAVELAAHAPEVQPVAASLNATTAAPPTVGLSMRRKIQLALVSAQALAEAGQLSRARDVLQSVKSTPELALEPPLAAECRLQEIELQAQALAAASVAELSVLLPRLRDTLAAVADPAERAVATARVGAALSRKAHLAATAREMLDGAQSGLDAIKDVAAKASARGDWALAKAQQLAAEVQTAASGGAMPRARTLAAEIETLALRAGLTSRVQLHTLAMAWRAQRQAGAKPDITAQLLERFFTTLDKAPSVSVRAAAMYDAAPMLGDGDAKERLFVAATALTASAASLPAAERYNALTDLSLLFAGLGAADRSTELARQVFAAVSPQQAEATEAAARLLLEREIITLRSQQAASRFVEADDSVQRLLSFLR